MQKLSKRKKAVLAVLDEEIEELEAKLAKFQPHIDELAQLKRARATLLSERSTTGAVSSATMLTMEMMVNFFREHDNEWAQPQEIADHFGIRAGVVRSHLSRGKDTRYAHDPDQGWCLIGEQPDKEDDDEEDDEDDE